MKRRRAFATAAAMAVAATISCAGEEFAGNDPPGYTCEYTAFGPADREIPRPSPDGLGMFDAMTLVRVTGHEESGSPENVINLAEVLEVVDGGLSEGSDIEVRDDFGVCLETGEEYYLLLNGPESGGYYVIPGPWSHFPLINNRVTLHTDMRKDELIGQFHGLDPVLFKMRFSELTGRTDIDSGDAS